MEELSAVNEETKSWGILWEFLVAATALVIGSCPSAMGILSFCELCTAVIRLNTRFTVKNQPSLPSLLFFATHILKINSDLLSGVQAAWTLSSLFALFSL